MRSHYNFEGLSRWSYGWDNPNHAAAVLAMVIPLLWLTEWCYQSREGIEWRRAGFFIAEVLFSILLGLTYSRGAALAWLASILVFGLASLKRASAPGSTSPKAIRFFLTRLGIFGIVIVATGLQRRFSIVAGGDASATNRLELWSGALQLIHACPLLGWGKDNSGLAYMQWVQSPEATTAYGGTVNSYLHVAVEFGLIGLIGFSWVLLAPILIVFRVDREQTTQSQAVLHCAAASLASFCVANVFNTLWVIGSVVWLPLILVGVIFYVSGKSWKRWFSPLCVSGAFAMILGGGVYLLSHRSAAGAKWVLGRDNTGLLHFRRSGHSLDSPEIVFFPDSRVLGPLYGKEIRQAMDDPRIEVDSFAICPDACSAVCASARALVFGRRFQSLGGNPNDRSLIAIFPVGPVPDTTRIPSLALEVLPQYDEIGYAGDWEEWGRIHGVQILVVPNSGQDLRPQWPRLLRAILSRTKS